MSLFTELGRRNVYRAAVIYAASAWLLVQVIDLVSPYFQIPDWTVRWVIVAASIGFPFWIAFAWFYEFTPEGLKRESEVEAHESITHVTGRKLDFAIIAVLALAVVLLLTDRFVLRQGVNQQASLPVPEQSIAVLPFADMSPGKDQEYFSDGISEELLNLLAKIPQLQVTARTSSFSFKGKDTPIREIAKTLRVAHVLEGSVRKSGDQVRVTAQLINAATDAHVWSQTYDRKLDDIFAIQDEIAADVVKQLKVTLLGEAPTVRQTNPEAYALYLQARQLGYQRTAEAYKQSDALYRQALAIDPRYAPAWTGLARNSINQTSIGVLANEVGQRLAREAAERAIAVDAGYAPAHAALARITSGDGDLRAAAQHLERALALDPSDPDVLGESAVVLMSAGRLREAIAVNEYVVSRDPVNVRSLANLGLYYRVAGRYDEAIGQFRTVLSLNPNRGGVHFGLGTALLSKGDAAGALAEVEQETSEVQRMLGLAMAYHALGRKAESDAAIVEVAAKYEKDFSYNIAYVHAFRGDADKSFEWLDKAVQYADSGLSEIAGQNLFDNVREDPRWLPFLRKLGKAPEQLEKIELKVPLPSTTPAPAPQPAPADGSSDQP